MANEKTIYATARFQFRHDTAENWATQNPILLAGEHGVVTDGTETEKEKIGDGVTPWNELGWWKGPKGDKGETGATGAQGEQGLKGEKGDKGDTGLEGLSIYLCRNPRTGTSDLQDAQIEIPSGRTVKVGDLLLSDTGLVYEVLDIVLHNIYIKPVASIKGPQGLPGEDYILTDEDKQEISDLVLSNFTDVSEVGQ